MRALIIEDSRLARAELKNLLQVHPEVALVGEAANAMEGIEKIKELQPDVVFLDIHMPGKDGFEMLEELEAIPIVIFTTAYDQYAIKSFEYNALDYLLKPIKPARLAMAIEKAKERVINNSEGQERATELLGEESQVFVKDGAQCWIVRLKKVRLMEVQGNYTRLYFDKNKPIIMKSLNYLEGRLDPTIFFRANRQQMIHLKWVENIEPWFKGKLKVQLRGGEEVEISRRQAVKFRELLSF